MASIPRAVIAHPNKKRWAPDATLFDMADGLGDIAN
jgi:hypothetical protein